jgi:hypothetical protein
MPYPSNTDMTNQCLTQYNLNAERERRWQRESDRINKKYYDLLSSKKSAPDTPASRALDKKLAEIDRQYYPPVNASKETGFTNRFSSWFGKK